MAYHHKKFVDHCENINNTMYHSRHNFNTYEGNYPIVTNPHYPNNAPQHQYAFPTTYPSTTAPYTYMTPYYNYYTYVTPINIMEEKEPYKRALPRRETPKLCQEYLKTGVCSYRRKCRYRHIRNDDEKEGLNSRGYPLRLDKKDCEFYCKKGWCGYGISCKFNHPEITHEIKSNQHSHSFKLFQNSNIYF